MQVFKCEIIIQSMEKINHNNEITLRLGLNFGVKEFWGTKGWYELYDDSTDKRILFFVLWNLIIIKKDLLFIRLKRINEYEIEYSTDFWR